MAEIVLAFEDPLDLLLAMKGVDTADPAAVERFREAACATCAASVGEDRTARLTLCQGLRCGLRDNAEFAAERYSLLDALTVLDDELRQDLHPEKARELRQRIWQRGALLLYPGLLEDGGFTLAVEARSLLARLHGAVVAYLARGGGDFIWNVSTGKTKDGSKLLGDARKAFRVRTAATFARRVESV